MKSTIFVKFINTLTLLIFALSFACCTKATELPLSNPSKEKVESPVKIIQSFYHWYLEEMIHDQNPIQDNREIMKKYVSLHLISAIEHRINSDEGMDSDYFTRAQDYLDDWVNNISVKNLRIKNRSATATVILGGSQSSYHKLNVQLILEHGVWRIIQVKE